MKKLVISATFFALATIPLISQPAQACHRFNPFCEQQPERNNRRTYGFTVINNSNKNVYIAKAGYEEGQNSSRAGDYNLPAVTSSYWWAEGWWTIPPRSRQTLFTGSVAQKDDIINLHMQSGGETIYPQNASSYGDLCIVNEKFQVLHYRDGNRHAIAHSRLHKGFSPNVVTKKFGKNSSSKKTCSDVRGYKAKFFSLTRHMSFTIN